MRNGTVCFLVKDKKVLLAKMWEGNGNWLPKILDTIKT